MTIDQIMCFLTVAEYKNFTKAANSLHITQPALSRTIMVIESEVGGSLFKRTKRLVELTPAGKEFEIHCKKIVDNYHKALERIRLCQEGSAGTLRIGFTSSAARCILPQIVTELRSEYPQLDIQLFDGNYFEIIDLLNEKKLDAGIVSDLAVNIYPALDSKLILEDSYCLVAPRTHWASSLESVTMEQIINECFITIDRNRSAIDMPITERNLLSHTITGKNYLLNIISSAKSIPSLLLMVACGQGVTVLAEHIQRDMDDALSFIPISDFNDTFKVSLVWNTENPNPYVSKINDLLDKDLCINFD